MKLIDLIRPTYRSGNRFRQHYKLLPTHITDFASYFCQRQRPLAPCKRFRAFTKTQSWHVVPPPLEKLLAANIQLFTNTISLRPCSFRLGPFCSLPSFVPNVHRPLGFCGSLALQPIHLSIPGTNMPKNLSIGLPKERRHSFNRSRLQQQLNNSVGGTYTRLSSD